MKTFANLLPLSYRRHQLLWSCSKRWLTVWCVLLVVGLFIAWIKFAQNHRARARLESLRQEYITVKKQADEVASLTQVIDQLRQREAIVLTLADEQSTLTLIGIVSHAAELCEGKLSVSRMHLTRRQDSEAARSMKVLTLEGVAVDNQLVARFAAALRDAATFDRVELKSIGRQLVNEIPGQVYSLECVF